MFNNAAKLELAFAGVALVLAIGVAAATGAAAFVLLLGVGGAVALSGLAFAGSGFTDRAPRYPEGAEPPVQMVSVGRSQAPKPSPWPLFGALALAVLTVGLATGHGLVQIGVVLGVLTAAGWLSQAWQEDPGHTRREGARVSERLLSPVGLPVLALTLIAVIVISVSRILLTLPRTGSIAAAFGLALAVLVAFFALSTQPHLAKRSLVLLSGVAVVALVSAGSVSAANGYRTFEHHDTGPGPLAVVARGTAFDVKTLDVVAGQETTLTFENFDHIYHNVAVYGADGTPYWNGEPIRGKKKITYVHTFDLPAGTYVFRCDFHPTSMIGTFVVSAAGSSPTP